MRGAFVECLSDFIAAIREDTEPRVTAIDGRQVTAVLDAITRSLCQTVDPNQSPGIAMPDAKDTTSSAITSSSSATSCC